MEYIFQTLQPKLFLGGRAFVHKKSEQNKNKIAYKYLTTDTRYMLSKEIYKTQQFIQKIYLPSEHF